MVGALETVGESCCASVEAARGPHKIIAAANAMPACRFIFIDILLSIGAVVGFIR
jgi:hypothetical protein